MATVWPLPLIETTNLGAVREARPTALVTGTTAWSIAASALDLPLVVQAEPHSAERSYLETLAESLPPQVEVVYGVGGGRVGDVAKYIGWKKKLPVVLIPTVLSVDGFFTALVAVREKGSVDYEITGPAQKVIIDWEIVSKAPPNLRGTGIAEILSIVTGLLDWRYAAERNKNTPETRFVQWAAQIAAGIAQQAFKIAPGVGEGRIDALSNLLDLILMEVQLTNQLGHNRPQEGSEQYFAYAVEPRIARGSTIPYADLVGPGILISAALHGQDVAAIRETLISAGVRVGQIKPALIKETLLELPEYVQTHNLPYSILHELQLTPDLVNNVMLRTGLDTQSEVPLPFN